MDMTSVSAKLFKQATSASLTISEAIRLLNEEAQIRTLKDKLEKFYGGTDLRGDLVNGLLKNHPDSKKDSIERKVRGWLNETERTISKDDAIELAFIMGLDFERADDFVTLVAEEKFHLRSPDEIVYMFALNNGMSYTDARAIYGKVSECVSAAAEQPVPKEKDFTSYIGSELLSLKTEQELVDFIRNSADRLGDFHNTAYKFFMEYLSILMTPQKDELDDMPQDENMTLRDVMEAYFDEKIIPKSEHKNDEKKRALLSAMQRNILQNWPNEFTMSRIKNRACDVSRKALILAFLVTNGGDSNYGEYGLDDNYDMYCDNDDYDMSEEDIFEDMYARMNYMLSDCGFGRLDPRVPFDWMIIYCMCVGEACDIDERKHKFLEYLFDAEEN